MWIVLIWSSKERAMPNQVVEGCRFCLENGLLDASEIVARTELGFLIKAAHSPVKDAYLMVPISHIEDDRDLPGNWQETRRELLKAVPWLKTYRDRNSNVNNGPGAGQTALHIHEWVIPRWGELPISTAYHVGLATLIGKANKAAEFIRDRDEYGMN